MLHSNFINNVIGMHESVYRDSPIGNLERFLVKSISPLQQGFYSDCNTGFSVAIDYLPTFALEQRIIGGTMPFSNSTAAGTPFASMPTINYIKCDMFIKAPCDKVMFKCEEGDSHNFSIELLPFRAKPLEIFYRNVSIILNGKVGNIPDNFAYPVRNKVMFFSFGLSEKLPCETAPILVTMTLKNALAFKYVFASNPDILSKITLMQNLSFWRNNGNRKTFAIYINSKNISLSCKDFIRFGEIGNNLQIRGQTISLTNPTILQKRIISLPTTIFDNKNRNAVLRIKGKFNKEHRFSVEWFRDILCNIELNSNAFGNALAFPDHTFNVADNVRMKIGVSFGS